MADLARKHKPRASTRKSSSKSPRASSPLGTRGKLLRLRQASPPGQRLRSTITIAEESMEVDTLQEPIQATSEDEETRMVLDSQPDSQTDLTSLTSSHVTRPESYFRSTDTHPTSGHPEVSGQNDHQRKNYYDAEHQPKKVHNCIPCRQVEFLPLQTMNIEDSILVRCNRTCTFSKIHLRTFYQ